MASETVRVFTVDQNGSALPGVLVRVFDITGTTLIAQGTSAVVGTDAVADFTLDGDNPPTSYSVRLSKSGVGFDGSYGDAFNSPQSIDVWSPPASSPTGKNDFEVKGQTFERPQSHNPRLCRCSGFLKDASGKPLQGAYIDFINQFRPLLVDGYVVLGERLTVRSDLDGYVEIDLYRGGIYEARVHSIDAVDPDGLVATREVHVPEERGWDVGALLFPVVGSVLWAPATAVLSVGGSLDVVPTIRGTDNRVLAGTALQDVIFESADPTIASIDVGSDKVTIRGVSAGATEVTIRRKDETVVVVPDTTVTGSPLSVTVN
jgi:hypothetical protein